MITGGLLTAALTATTSLATPVPQNLGNGLREIVQQQQQKQQAGARGTSPAAAPTSAFSYGYDRLKITDAQNRVLVSVHLDGSVAIADMQKAITASGARITVTNSRYRKGVIEAFASTDQAVSLAKMPGVANVNLVLKPYNNVGKATTQGIVQHRIDKVPNGIKGDGITVGVLSDSFNNAGGPVKAGDDVASGDLPGPANPFGRTKPVVILQDDFGNDEGRAMLQIVHDIAPNARLGFATAFTGEAGFADNIRSLAGLPTGSLSRPNFKANVIIDDVIYFAEPMFQDGMIAQAVDDVAAAGVAYFSSAGNQPGSEAYDAPFRLLPNGAAATAGTNLNFKNVDPNLYKGGFHNFLTDGTQDIAQTIQLGGSSILVFQWNEPFDSTPPTLGKTLQSGSGTLTNSMPTKSFPFAGTAGQHIGIFADAAPGSSNPLPDVTIRLLDPQGNEVAFEDSTTNPELLVTFLPVTGNYTIVIGGFLNATGDFIYKVREASGTALVETDFNVLFFDTNGKFLFAFSENNRATSEPIEIGQIFGAGPVQMVIARANKPPQGAPRADRLRYVWYGATLGEFLDYTTPTTYGHAVANGSNCVAAYPFYPPFVPESFTSPGPVTIYFDADNNPLSTPDFRKKPEMAAMDGANTTFFVSDASQDPDNLPNFFGTSASAPHAGGIAALVLQAAGGPHSLSPDAVRKALEDSAFPHDLDPSHSAAIAQKNSRTMVVSADGDGTNTSSADPNFFTVSFAAPGSLSSLALDLANANPTEAVKGLVFDPSATTGFPFTLGNLKGVPPSSISTAFSMSPTPNYYFRLKLSIASGAMTSGDVIHFGVDRDEADAFGPNRTVGGNSADLLGAGVLIPEGTIASGGATVTATLFDGSTLEGTFRNNIGKGFSPLDGFGFINAQAAVNAVQH